MSNTELWWQASTVSQDWEHGSKGTTQPTVDADSTDKAKREQPQLESYKDWCQQQAQIEALIQIKWHKQKAPTVK